MSSWGASKSQKRKCDTRSACAVTPGACPRGGGSLKDNEHAKEDVGTPAKTSQLLGFLENYNASMGPEVPVRCTCIPVG